MERDRLGRKRQPEQERGLRPLHPPFPRNGPARLCGSRCPRPTGRGSRPWPGRSPRPLPHRLGPMAALSRPCSTPQICPSRSPVHSTGWTGSVVRPYASSCPAVDEDSVARPPEDAAVRSMTPRHRLSLGDRPFRAVFSLSRRDCFGNRGCCPRKGDVKDLSLAEARQAAHRVGRARHAGARGRSASGSRRRSRWPACGCRPACTSRPRPPTWPGRSRPAGPTWSSAPPTRCRPRTTSPPAWSRTTASPSTPSRARTSTATTGTSPPRLSTSRTSPWTTAPTWSAP